MLFVCINACMCVCMRETEEAAGKEMYLRMYVTLYRMLFLKVSLHKLCGLKTWPSCFMYVGMQTRPLVFVGPYFSYDLSIHLSTYLPTLPLVLAMTFKVVSHKAK